MSDRPIPNLDRIVRELEALQRSFGPAEEAMSDEPEGLLGRLLRDIEGVKAKFGPPDPCGPIPIRECSWLPADVMLVLDENAFTDIIATKPGITTDRSPKLLADAEAEKECLRRILSKPGRCILVKNIGTLKENPAP